MADHMLTTVDNPFDPYSDYEKWFAFDTSMRYNTCGLLARFTKSSDELSEADQDDAIEQAMDDIIANDPLGIFMKVTRGMIKKQEAAS